MNVLITYNRRLDRDEGQEEERVNHQPVAFDHQASTTSSMCAALLGLGLLGLQLRRGLGSGLPQDHNNTTAAASFVCIIVNQGVLYLFLSQALVDRRNGVRKAV